MCVPQGYVFVPQEILAKICRRRGYICGEGVPLMGGSPLAGWEQWDSWLDSRGWKVVGG